ncbi:MAG: ABC transporter ATP-binding protein/permease, partial [Symbiobacteriaceae bacterium]|nr:ABC transporter ATP-binding protein/permease [Symbiobacteriaceae bacterium]
WCDLRIPQFMQEITLLVQSQGGAPGELMVTGAFMLLAALGSLLASLATGYFASQGVASFAKRLRQMVYDQVDSFALEELGRFSVSSLITRATNDVMQLQSFLATGLQMFVKAPIMACWALIKIAQSGRAWTLATGVTLVLLLTVTIITMSFTLPRFKKMQSLVDRMTKVMREHLTGLRVIRAYNAEEFQSQRFNQANQEITENQLQLNRLSALQMPFTSMLQNCLSIAVFFIGALLINQAFLPAEKQLLFGNTVVISSYTSQVVVSFMMLSVIFNILPQVSVSAGRINELLLLAPSIISGRATSGLTPVRGQVEFRDVSFKYPEAADYTLKNISFTCEPGETVAIIGSTGSGKSTLLNLAARFYDVTAGEILVDGRNIKEYDLETLYAKLGYLPQTAVTFSGTVGSNVAYGSDVAYSEEEIHQALEIAQASSFVAAMGGLDSMVARGGLNLSGGQKQRLSIARALARKPEIYLMDDTFSALDYGTEKALRQALRQEAAEASKLVVSQRIATIMDADKIVVLDQGKVVGLGKHRELLENCQVYQEIALSQLSKEELVA